MDLSLWQQCTEQLKNTLTQQAFNQWINPLQSELTPDGLVLWAPNNYVLEGVSNNYLTDLRRILIEITHGDAPRVVLKVGAKKLAFINEFVCGESEKGVDGNEKNSIPPKISGGASFDFLHKSTLNSSFTLDYFVVGKSNQLAVAAAKQIAENPGGAYNPFFLYGSVGLGKTHLMQAIGNALVEGSGGKSNVVYMHSERFVAEMVKAIQHNKVEEFKRYYRSVDALLIDDIQFFSGKERSQEEFFHTFNSLLEGQQQVILTSDRFPKEIKGLEARLRSRFGSGLTVAIEPPELETRVAILMQKAAQEGTPISTDVAVFMAKRVKSNIRELEGALKRVLASRKFTGKIVTLDFVQDALKDVLAVEAKQVSLDNIIKSTASYYKITPDDLLSKQRCRSVARPRQLSMALCKQLTNHSLPEIGAAFGDRDHTTVLHACRQIKELRNENASIDHDYMNLVRILST